MQIHSSLMASLAFALATTVAHADPFCFTSSTAHSNLATIDLSTGAFQQIGPPQPEAGSFGLATTPDGSLRTFAYSGNVYSINPTTGAPALVGASGLDDCATVASPCGPTSASTLGNYAGKIYATDFQNSLYSINPATGAATLIGPTGILGIPFVPGSFNPDGTINFYDQAIFGSPTGLYVTFDAFVFDLNTFTVVSTVISPELYQIDPSSGAATLVCPTGKSRHRCCHRRKRHLLRIQRPAKRNQHARPHQRQHQLRNQLRLLSRRSPGSSAGAHARAIVPHSIGDRLAWSRRLLLAKNSCKCAIDSEGPCQPPNPSKPAPIQPIHVAY